MLPNILEPGERSGCCLQSRKKKCFYTIFIVPHNENAVHSFRLPRYAIKLFSLAMVIALVSSFIWFQSHLELQKETVEAYRSLQEETAETNRNLQEEKAKAQRLKQENHLLGEQFNKLALETEELIYRFQELESFSEEVREVVLEMPAQEKEEQIAFLSATNQESTSTFSMGAGEVVDRTANNLTYLESAITGQMVEMEVLKSDLEEHQQELNSTPSIWPASGRVTSEFGMRRSPFSGRSELHTGIDIANSWGTPVLAAADGTVSKVEYKRGLGNMVEIEHGYGYRTLYAHLSDFMVSVGDAVAKKQQIATMGSTGASTGPHLHYEIHKNGVEIDPRPYLP